MRLEKEHYEKIRDCFPRQRKPAKISNLDILNAVLYLLENGGGWRNLPEEYGDWHVIYVRVNRWMKKGILQAAFLRLQQMGLLQVQVKLVGRTISGGGEGETLQKAGVELPEPQRADGASNFIWLPYLNGEAEGTVFIRYNE